MTNSTRPCPPQMPPSQLLVTNRRLSSLARHTALLRLYRSRVYHAGIGSHSWGILLVHFRSHGSWIRTAGVFRKILDNDKPIHPVVMCAAVVLAVSMCVYLVYGKWTQMDRRVAITRLCATDGCGHRSARELKLGETFPGRCPKCGRQSVYVAYRCPSCSTPNVLNENFGTKGPTPCSRCRRELRYGG
jgi:hypothetical protein